jgi:hypothetical protein
MEGVMGSFVDRLVRADIGSRVYAMYPAQALAAIPEMPLNGMDAGNGGLIRGWGLQFGPLRRLVSRDGLFRRASRVGRGRSLLNDLRRINLFLLIRFYFADLACRDIIELGVYRGGNAFFMAKLLAELYPGAKVYAFDTYAGMPKTQRGIDLHVAGDFADASLDEIKQAAHDRGIRNIEFVKGDVRDTLSGFQAPVGLAHIDLDIYDPIAYAQDIMWERLVPGGYLVYDDATVASCLGATRAVEEFLVKHGIHSEQIYPHFVFHKQPSHEAAQTIGQTKALKVTGES